MNHRRGIDLSLKTAERGTAHLRSSALMKEFGMARFLSWEKIALTASPRRFRSEATRLRKIGSSRGLTRRELQKSPGDRQQCPGLLMPRLQLLDAQAEGLRIGLFQIGQSALQPAEPGLPRVELPL